MQCEYCPADRRDAATDGRVCQLDAKGIRSAVGGNDAPYEGIPELLDALTVTRHPHGRPLEQARRVHQALRGPTPTRLAVRGRAGGGNLVAQEARPGGRKGDRSSAGRCSRRSSLPGDTNTDMQTAVAAGMFPVVALWGFRTADELTASGEQALVEKPLDLLDILDAKTG